MRRKSGIFLCAALAWILWSKLVGPSTSTGWEIGGSYDSRADCKLKHAEKIQGTISTFRAGGMSAYGDGGNEVHVVKGGNFLIFRFLCLPETIDPRKPGKP